MSLGLYRDLSLNVYGGFSYIPSGDNTAPIITLIGQSSVSHQLGTTYTDSGATATDNNDGDITANIIVGGDTVDTNTPGTYTITYNVSDAAGNAAAQVSRTVTVQSEAVYLAPKEILKISRTNDLVYLHNGNEIPITNAKHPRAQVFKGFVLLGMEDDETIISHSILINDQPVNVGDAVDSLVFHGSQTDGVKQVKAEISGGISGHTYRLTVNYSTQYVPSDYRSQDFEVKPL